jgi:hypothetical protein
MLHLAKTISSIVVLLLGFILIGLGADIADSQPTLGLLIACTAAGVVAYATVDLIVENL